MKKIKGWVKRLKRDQLTRVVILCALIAVGFLVIHLVDNVITHIDPATWSYEDHEVFPHFPPAGNDFRVGYYWPAVHLVRSHFTSIGAHGDYPSNYPPLVALTSLPYALFNVSDAYLVHVVLLILANLACLWMGVMLARRFILILSGLNMATVNWISLLFFILGGVYLFSSYFFAYSMERGNTDIFALFYSLLALWVLVHRPKALWLQVILLSVAVHFKIYPIILFALLWFKHGKGVFLPTLLVNLVFLFCLGPKMALQFLQSASAGGTGVGIGNAWSNIANHASYSFSIGMDTSSDTVLTGSFFILWAVTVLVPLLMWAISTISIALKKYSTPAAIVFFMVSVPVMNLAPTVSMDYKLVILVPAILLLLALIVAQFAIKFTWFDLIQVLFLLGVLAMLGRSYAFIGKDQVFFANKYIWVLFLEASMAINILRMPSIFTRESVIQPSTNG